MRFNKLNLNLLVALDHLLNLRSVSEAAMQMNMTQSAMSNALLRLREYFGDDLLVKIGRRMELTPRAEYLEGRGAGRARAGRMDDRDDRGFQSGAVGPTVQCAGL